MSFLAALDQLNIRGPQIGRVGDYLFKPLEGSRLPRTCVFDSRAAHQRFIELVETSERMQTRSTAASFRGGFLTMWFIHNDALLARWTMSKSLYSPDLKFKELDITNSESEWEEIRRAAKVYGGRDPFNQERDLGTALHPTNLGTSVNLDFRPDTYWPGRMPSPILDHTTMQPIPEPVNSGLSPTPDGVTGISGRDFPKLEPGEVEIARLTETRTANREVIRVIAHMQSNIIHYRIVKKRTGKKGIMTPVVSSTRPLTMAEIVGLLDHAVEHNASRIMGLYFGRLNHWAHDPKTSVPADELRGAIRVDSAFYPALGRWYDETFETWCEREQLEHGTADTRGHHEASREPAADPDEGAAQE